MSILSLQLVIFLLIQLLAVAWIDFKYRKIANAWSVLNVAIFIISFFFINNSGFEFGHFYYPVIFFLVGFAFYTLRIMGGGDSKYLVSIYLLIPRYFHEGFLYVLLYVVVFIGVTQFIYNTYSGRKLLVDFWKYKDVVYLKNCYGKKFPFAPLILLSWIIFTMNNLENIK